MNNKAKNLTSDEFADFSCQMTNPSEREIQFFEARNAAGLGVGMENLTDWMDWMESNKNEE